MGFSDKGAREARRVVGVRIFGESWAHFFMDMVWCVNAHTGDHQAIALSLGVFGYLGFGCIYFVLVGLSEVDTRSAKKQLLSVHLRCVRAPVVSSTKIIVFPVARF